MLKGIKPTPLPRFVSLRSQAIFAHVFFLRTIFSFQTMTVSSSVRTLRRIVPPAVLFGRCCRFRLCRFRDFLSCCLSRVLFSACLRFCAVLKGSQVHTAPAILFFVSLRVSLPTMFPWGRFCRFRVYGSFVPFCCSCTLRLIVPPVFFFGCCCRFRSCRFRDFLFVVLVASCYLLVFASVCG